MKTPTSGGGWPAIWYVLKKSREAGGFLRLYRAMRSRNACKTCALGMGGQRGGMVNEQGHFPEVCKKSIQAMVADMQPAIPVDFWSRVPVDQLRHWTPRELETAGRLVTPMRHRLGQPHYEPITWEAAFQRIAEALKSASADESFWYFSGRSSNEAGFLLQLFARLYGTNNVNNCSYYCHQASGVGLSSSVGTGTATIVLEDVEQADLVFLIGGNPASNHPRLMTTLRNVRRRGGDVIVINPVVEAGLVKFRIPSDPISLVFGSKIASQYVQPHIGGDLALLWGIAKRIDELGACDEAFLKSACDNYQPWMEQVRTTSWPEIVTSSGVEQEVIDRVARRYAQAERAVFGWTMGITHHEQGVENVQAIANLALMRGMVGKPGAGLMPIRGHSNVQGIGSVGVTPRLKDEIFARLQSDLGLNLPTSPGLDTMSCMEAAHEGRLRAGVCLGGNLFGSNPDSVYAERALANVDLMVYLNTTLNTGHARGLGRETIILPVLARDEEPEPTTQESMFNLVRMSDGGPRRLPGPKSEVEVVSRLADAVLGTSTPINWTSLQQTQSIRQMIAQVIPGWTQIGDIDNSRREFQIEGRTLHEPRFPTSSGRARLHVHQLRPMPAHDDSLRLMTVRSEGQFNTVVYEEADIYRGQDRRDVILLHGDCLQRLGLRHNQVVRVSSETGHLDGILARRFDNIRPGNALMYFPEANVLVPRTVDPKSRTPAFKCIWVRVRPSQQA